MFPEIDPLPCPESQPPLDDGDRKRRRSQRRLDVRRHVVRPFERVGEVGIVLRHMTIQPLFQIAPRRGIGVFLNRQARRGVLDHDRAESFGASRSIDNFLHLSRDFMEALTRCSDGDALDHDCRLKRDSVSRN